VLIGNIYPGDKCAGCWCINWEGDCGAQSSCWDLSLSSDSFKTHPGKYPRMLHTHCMETKNLAALPHCLANVVWAGWQIARQMSVFISFLLFASMLTGSGFKILVPFEKWRPDKGDEKEWWWGVRICQCTPDNYTHHTEVNATLSHCHRVGFLLEKH